MTISELIFALQDTMTAHGDIQVSLQSNPHDGKGIVGHDEFFVVVEQYDLNDRNAEHRPQSEMVCNIRSWPY